MKQIVYWALMVATLAACAKSKRDNLPILGERALSPAGDTIYPTVPAFAFVDQDSQRVTNATFAGKIYVSDFFFIHCTTLCPKVRVQVKRIYEKYKNDPRVAILSHSLDVKNDTVAALRRYADKLGIDSKKWIMVTGEHDSIYGIADKYYVSAVVDADAQGGFTHDGRLVLVDTKGHVRSYCEGKLEKEVTRFIEDIDLLLRLEFGPNGK